MSKPIKVWNTSRYSVLLKGSVLYPFKYAMMTLEEYKNYGCSSLSLTKPEKVEAAPAATPEESYQEPETASPYAVIKKKVGRKKQEG